MELPSGVAFTGVLETSSAAREIDTGLHKEAGSGVFLRRKLPTQNGDRTYYTNFRRKGQLVPALLFHFPSAVEAKKE